MQELEEGTRQALQGEEHKNEALQGVVASFPVVSHPESSPNPQGFGGDAVFGTEPEIQKQQEQKEDDRVRSQTSWRGPRP